jgi:hypothetical protein
LERLISILSRKDPVPAWAVSLIGVIVGAVLTTVLGVVKERREAKRRLKGLERAIYGELLLNHMALLGTLMTKYEFDRIAPHQEPFGGMLTWDTLDNAREHGDVLYDVPNFALLRTLYKCYQGVAAVKGGGHSAQALAADTVRHFETVVAQGNLNQKLCLDVCNRSIPNLTPRLRRLVGGEIRPGHLE